MKIINKLLNKLKLESIPELIVLNARDNIHGVTKQLQEALDSGKIEVKGVHIKAKKEILNLENEEDKKYVLLLSYQLYNVCKETIEEVLDKRNNLNLLFYGNHEHRNEDTPENIPNVNRAKGERWDYMIKEEIDSLAREINSIFDKSQKRPIEDDENLF